MSSALLTQRISTAKRPITDVEDIYNSHLLTGLKFSQSLLSYLQLMFGVLKMSLQFLQ